MTILEQVGLPRRSGSRKRHASVDKHIRKACRGSKKCIKANKPKERQQEVGEKTKATAQKIHDAMKV